MGAVATVSRAAAVRSKQSELVSQLTVAVTSLHHAI